VWLDGHARVLVDMGSGSLLRFEQGGARIEDLDVVLFSHFHVDHSADFPALVKASYFSGRKRDLPVFGPTGNATMPGTDAFVRALFAGPQGAFRYLNGYLNGEESYRIRPHEVSADDRAKKAVWNRNGLQLVAVPVHHGPIPALAWRVEISGHVLVFSGDMNGDYHTLPGLAKGADLLVAHNAVPEGATGAARNLHMPPSVIGRIAGEADVKFLVLSHFMRRTLGREIGSEREIRKYYHGPLAFADDGACFAPWGSGDLGVSDQP
jgi:ribonuclease BN (tRNA processing enzyme)